MEERDYIIYDGELYHYGRKGMKWGQHIFAKVKTGANKVAAGTKKAAIKAKAGVDKARAKRAEKRAVEEAKKRASIKNSRQLTTDELHDRIKRLELEKRYQDLMKETEQVSRGKKFVNDFADKAVSPALVDSGKRLLTDFLYKKGKEMMGLEAVDPNNELRKTVESLRLKGEQKDLERKLSGDSAYDTLKKTVEEQRLKNELKDLERKSKDDSGYDELKRNVENLRLQNEQKDLERKLNTPNDGISDEEIKRQADRASNEYRAEQMKDLLEQLRKKRTEQ